MIRVLITGQGSYIGTRLAQWLSREPERFEIRELDVKNGVDARAFAGVDSVVHVAGIAHRRSTEEEADLYRRVNCGLALECARAAKAAGVRQFVFFSSMSVYGLVTGRIDAGTVPAPNTPYGRSKWEAEQALAELSDDRFHIAVLRPPMVYGRGCKGNYPRLSALARSLPLFPKVQNERSMLYIGTLCAFLRRLIESGQGGLYFPQNRAYVNTSEMVCQIARCQGRRLRRVPGFGRLLRAAGSRVNTIGKVFGTLTYDQAMSGAFRDENELAFTETIRLTEANK